MDTTNNKSTAPRGMLALKRLFGASNVSEEMLVPPAFSTNNAPRQEEWCYVVDIPPDSDLLSITPETPFDYTASVSAIEGKICDLLLLHQCMDPETHNEFMTDVSKFQQLGTRRFIIPIEIAETEEAIAKLETTSCDRLTITAKTEAIEIYQEWLIKASRGIRWQYKEDAEGCYFETITSLTRNPRELEMGICSLLNISDEILMPAIDGKARIPLRAIIHGNRELLPETKLPKPASPNIRLQ